MRVRKTNRRGVIVVLFALLVPVLLIILGFTVDFAHMQRVRNEAQCVADLAAKAATNELAITQSVEAARAKAKAIAAANYVGSESITLEDEDIVFGKAVLQSDGTYQFNEGTTPFNSVEITIDRSAGSVNGATNLFFGRFYGKTSFDVVKTAQASFIPVEICLVLDRSGSMKHPISGTASEDRDCFPPPADSRWTALAQSVDIFLNELEASPAEERVALVTFASAHTKCDITISESSLDQNFTSNLNNVRNRMTQLNSTIWFGMTNIEAGMVTGKSVIQMGTDPSSKRVMIVLTDGKYNTGGDPAVQAAALKAMGVTVHSITFSDEANQADMIRLAENGGGNHHHAVTEQELKNIFRRLATTFSIITE